jgi:chemotaxis protein CheY-P-specific phosphatase CheC
MLTGRDDISELGPFEESALREVGNILCSAFVGAISPVLRLSLLPTPPTSNFGSLTGQIHKAAGNYGSDVVGLACEFGDAKLGFRGSIVVLLNEKTSVTLAQSMGIQLNA